MQPGDVVGPGGTTDKDVEKPAEETVAPPAIIAEAEAPKEVAEQPPQEPASNWQFSQDDQSQADVPSAPVSRHDPVTWTASEYIAHEKAGNWYVLLALAVFVLAAVVYFLTKEVVSTVVIIIMGLAFGTFAARKPQELTYVLDNTALTVGNKAYPYSQFKSFTVLEEGAIHSIMLMPLQRFMPPLSVYYDPKDENKIAEALSSYLPYEDRKQDAVDRLMRKVRF
jgi:hypothetical protein